MIRINSDPDYGKGGWRNHPVVKMWAPYNEAHKLYFNVCLAYWFECGKNSDLTPFPVDESKVVLPPWFGYEPYHQSHRAALLYKAEPYYRQWGWTETPSLDYWYPEGVRKKAA